MKLLHKMIDFECLETSQKNVCDEVYLEKLQIYSVQTATLLSTDFTANCFRNMFWKLVVLKKFFWEKYLYCVNIRITLLPCSAQPTILPKL